MGAVASAVAAAPASVPLDRSRLEAVAEASTHAAGAAAASPSRGSVVATLKLRLCETKNVFLGFTPGDFPKTQMAQVHATLEHMITERLGQDNITAREVLRYAKHLLKLCKPCYYVHKKSKSSCSPCCTFSQSCGR